MKHPHHLGSIVKAGTAALLIGAVGILGGLTQPEKKDNAKPGAPIQKLEAKKEPAAAKHDFSIDSGTYAETCTCRPPCPCELTGAVMGCNGVGAYELSKATYNGADISGTKFAYALGLGDWLNIYVDQPDPKKHDAAVAFAKGALAGFAKDGKANKVVDAKIKIEEKNGAYTASVNDGKIMSFRTEPVLGGDKKTPITHSNTHDPVNPVFLQGECVEASYKDGDQKFEIDQGRNSYFNNHIKSSGSV